MSVSRSAARRGGLFRGSFSLVGMLGCQVIDALPHPLLGLHQLCRASRRHRYGIETPTPDPYHVFESLIRSHFSL